LKGSLLNFTMIQPQEIRPDLLRSLNFNNPMKSSTPFVLRRLVLLRHGQSQWNFQKKFTGWFDIGLSEQGVQEAMQAGRILKQNGLQFDIAYTSYLQRAILTYNLLSEELDCRTIPIISAWQLNERHYGALTGLCKAQTSSIFGADKVKEWRRHFDTIPPLMDPTDPRAPHNDPKYSHIDPKLLPLGESLKDTSHRTLPYFKEHILPQVTEGKNVLVVAHNHSLRSIVKELDGISDAGIAEVSISTGVPLVYEICENGKVVSKYTLSIEEVMLDEQESFTFVSI